MLDLLKSVKVMLDPKVSENLEELNLYNRIRRLIDRIENA